MNNMNETISDQLESSRDGIVGSYEVPYLRICFSRCRFSTGGVS